MCDLAVGAIVYLFVWSVLLSVELEGDILVGFLTVRRVYEL